MAKEIQKRHFLREKDNITRCLDHTDKHSSGYGWKGILISFTRRYSALPLEEKNEYFNDYLRTFTLVTDHIQYLRH